MQVVVKLIDSIRKAAAYNPEVQVAPACILWPDKERQWEAVIPRLQNEMPELLVLGPYLPQQRSGPAIWLRYILAGKMPEILNRDENKIPVLYLAGVSRQDLRAVENCPEHLKPLAELQYRGNIWSQVNGKDITILAFLSSEQGGLGLNVARNNDARSAMQMALANFLDEEWDLLKGKYLDKNYFNTLLTGGDPVRDMLHWLDQGDAFRYGRGENEWRALVEVWKSGLAFQAEKEGLLSAAVKLAMHEGPWSVVWERFCEAPGKYPHIPELIRKCQMPQVTLFSDINTHGGWPQWNELQENDLRRELQAMGDMTPQQARDRLIQLEKIHGSRRQLVWAELGQAPLACALEQLAALAIGTNNSLAGGELNDLVTAYAAAGWATDDAMLKTLASISSQEDLSAVKLAIRSVYLPWADESARYLQSIIRQQGYPAISTLEQPLEEAKSGECILFVDGLRFDSARRLGKYLMEKGCQLDEKLVWAALPTITATGKPAVTPVKSLISGQEAGADFTPVVTKIGQTLKGGHTLRKLLEDSGWTVLGASEYGDPNKAAWCEFGDLDKEGHKRGWKIARQMDELIKETGERVIQLLQAKWKKVHIVTDHGWLLLPGGLPKVELPAALVTNKWGRMATIKAGALVDEHLYPWYWNSEHTFALAGGIGCYRAGEEYAHGGLSLQECLNIEMTVSYKVSNLEAGELEISDIKWKSMRCTVALEGSSTNFNLDIRLHPGDPRSSVVVNVKKFNDSGVASVVVEDEELLGLSATIIITNMEKRVLAQRETIIGGGKA